MPDPEQAWEAGQRSCCCHDANSVTVGVSGRYRGRLAAESAAGCVLRLYKPWTLIVAIVSSVWRR